METDIMIQILPDQGTDGPEQTDRVKIIGPEADPAQTGPVFFQHFIHDRRQQLLHAGIVGIKGLPVDIRPFRKLSDCNLLEGFFFQKFYESPFDICFGPPYSSVVFSVHLQSLNVTFQILLLLKYHMSFT